MKDELQSVRERTKDYALRVIRLYMALSKTNPAQIIGKQLLRSGTSVGAQYREAHRAKSDADFVSKIEGALQELDEAAYWIELLAESGVVSSRRLAGLVTETDELTAILVTITKRVKARSKP
ncbi:four helix bundle protein [bacterium]|nr:four helix bundle protein [bacterium]MBU1985213.1 four helix bundle protein [bacterium]